MFFQDSINRETEQALHDRKRLKAIDLGKVKQGSSTSVTNTSGSLSSGKSIFNQIACIIYVGRNELCYVFAKS